MKDSPTDWILNGLENETIRPFRGYEYGRWHIWIEEWSPLCIESEWNEEDVQDQDEVSCDTEERRALDVAMAEFDRDLVKTAPGRIPDHEDYYNTHGIFGYQVLMWKERPGEDWSRWTEVLPGLTGSLEDGFGVMRRVVPVRSRRAPACPTRMHR
jgi:hypothetical protein